MQIVPLILGLVEMLKDCEIRCPIVKKKRIFMCLALEKEYGGGGGMLRYRSNN